MKIYKTYREQEQEEILCNKGAHEIMFKMLAKKMSESFNENEFEDAVLFEQRKFNDGKELIVLKDTDNKHILTYSLIRYL